VPLTGHTIHRHQHHFCWDRSIAPVVSIAPGESLQFEVNDASAGQIRPGATAVAFDNYNSDTVNPVTGPVYVEGAEPGDALVVRVESYAPSGWGWTANIPGFGLLADDFPNAALLHWNYDVTGSQPLLFSNVAAVPLAPFAGTIGVAPAEPGPHDIIPPRRVGGNMDVRDLVAGSVLYLPVEAEGALFSVGDTHAAQGDGEVCGTAIESPMRVALTFDLEKGCAPAMPRINAPARLGRVSTPGRVHIAAGIGPDLMEASRAALRNMIDLLAQRHGLSPLEAYMLCSVAGDLRISQIVDAPNWTVSFHIADTIFS
jgi:acetamidase/formamidase